jgi:urate oxidase
VAPGDIVLGENQYGKAEVRVVRIKRDTPVHEIEDLTVTSQLRGDFRDCHETGDNARVVATDTQKNTVYAFAKTHGVGSPEAFLMTLGEHFLSQFPWISGGRWEAECHAWQRIAVGGQPHAHAFVRTSQEVRTAVVQRYGQQVQVLAGLKDCVVLKSSGSEFRGFPRDRFTTLVETDDRVMATSLTAWWRYTTTEVDFNERYDAIKQILLETFADVHSLALQQTVFQMGKSVLLAFDDIAEVKLSCPNKHHFVVDLAPFGLENRNEVFYAADRPYGLIEAAVVREGAPEAPEAWSTVPAFA